MSRILIGGGVTSKATVTSAGVKILTRSDQAKYIRITNTGDSYAYLAPSNKTTNAATIGEGIALAPRGEYGSYIEFDQNKFFRSDIWAISEVDTDLAIFIGH